MEGCLSDVSRLDESVLPVALELSVEGMGSSLAPARVAACQLVSNLADHMDATSAVAYLPGLMNDSDDTVRVVATCAVGHLGKHGLDVRPCLPALRTSLQDPVTAEWSAWSLAKLAQRGVDISVAHGELVRLLERPHDYSEPIRHATTALLHSAKRDASAAKRVQQLMAKARFAKRSKLLERFLRSLSAL